MRGGSVFKYRKYVFSEILSNSVQHNKFYDTRTIRSRYLSEILKYAFCPILETYLCTNIG